MLRERDARINTTSKAKWVDNELVWRLWRRLKYNAHPKAYDSVVQTRSSM